METAAAGKLQVFFVAVAHSINVFPAAVPGRPDPPVVGKVTHHSIELYWNNPAHSPAAGPLIYTVQQESGSSVATGAGTVYQ